MTLPQKQRPVRGFADEIGDGVVADLSSGIAMLNTFLELSTGHTFVSFVYIPPLDALTFKIRLQDCITKFATFSYRLLFWQEETFDLKDLTPFWYLWQVYWPVVLLFDLLGIDS